MAQALVMQRSNNKTWVAALAIASAAGAGWAWWSQDKNHNDTGAPTAQPAAQSPSTTARQTTAPAPAAEAKTPADAPALAAQQQAAAQAIERTPAMKPITGPITARPDFVSELEWTMLKGVAQQHPNPDDQLTRMVNNLRFTKQLELWQSMGNASETAKRHLIAEELLSDLPQRLTMGDIDLPQAKQYQADLLKDLVPDPQQRKARAQQEARRLVIPAK